MIQHTAVGIAEGVDIGTDVLINIQNATGGAGNDSITGNSVDNVLTGGGGDDTIVGGGGIDTAAYTATINTDGITDDNGGHFVVATGGSEGTDTLSGVEKIDGAGTPNILLVGNGGYASIQAAVNAGRRRRHHRGRGRHLDRRRRRSRQGHYHRWRRSRWRRFNSVTINGQITVDGTLNRVQGHRSQYQCDRQVLWRLRLGQFQQLWRLGDARRRGDLARPEQRLRLYPRRQRIDPDPGRHDRLGVRFQQHVQRQRHT